MAKTTEADLVAALREARANHDDDDAGLTVHELCAILGLSDGVVRRHLRALAQTGRLQVRRAPVMTITGTVTRQGFRYSLKNGDSAD